MWTKVLSSWRPLNSSLPTLWSSSQLWCNIKGKLKIFGYFQMMIQLESCSCGASNNSMNIMILEFWMLYHSLAALQLCTNPHSFNPNYSFYWRINLEMGDGKAEWSQKLNDLWPETFHLKLFIRTQTKTCDYFKKRRKIFLINHNQWLVPQCNLSTFICISVV